MKKKRLAVFVIYDPDGMVDDFRVYILKELKTVCESVCVVCNGEMEPEAIQILQGLAEEVHIRENTGLDVEAYKAAFFKYIGWKKIRTYDEIILINDTFYGPFIHLEQIFKTMEERASDFWGITAQYPMKNCFGENYEHEYLPYHINSYFLVIREALLKNFIFEQYWACLPCINSFSDAVVKFELTFTQYFLQKGFKCSTYVNMDALKESDEEYNLSYLYYYPRKLILEYDCPILKRKNFVLPQEGVIAVSMGEDLSDILYLIRQKFNYDVSMIWKHLIRTLDPMTLNSALKLWYILPSGVSDSCISFAKRIAVIAHLNYSEQLDEGIAYLKNLPDGVDVVITTKTEENKRNLEKKLDNNNFKQYEVILIGEKGREIRGMLIECRHVFQQHEYVCFVHDKRTNKGSKDGDGDAFRHMLFDNMLKSRDYINNIIELLENEKYLGLLVPPAPYQGNYFHTLGRAWTCNFKAVEQLSERLGLKCIMSEENQPLSLGTTFWCKTKALSPLFEMEFTEDDFEAEPLSLDGTINHAIERIFSYVAQSQGYATGIVMNDEYASQYMETYHHMITGILDRDRKSLVFSTYTSYLNQLNDPKLKSFLQSNSRNYIYGAGECAGRMTKTIKRLGLNFEGYVVSDGHRKMERLNNKPVYVLSELSQEISDIGIVLALNKENQKQVLPLLRESGYTRLFCR